MIKLLRLVIAITVAVTLQQTAVSQSLSVNTTGAIADASAIFDVTSTAKGVLIPRMNKTQKTAIGTPANGLLVYQTGPDSIGFHYYDLPNTRWIYINPGAYATDTAAWKLTGNSNVVDTSFLGSINNKALKFRVNNTASGIVDSTSGNTGLGYRSLITNTAAGFYANTAMGFGSGQALGGGYANTLMGRHTLSVSNGSAQNIAIGDSAMSRGFGVGGNTAVGFQALKQINGLGFFTYNTAIGYASQNAPTGTINGPFSYYNTSVGGYAMADNMAGYENVAMGVSALRFNDSSAGNTAIGMNAMAYHKRSGYNANTAVGGYAMENDSISFWNTAIGSEALRYNKNGSVNTALGFRSMRNHKTGGENTALGVGTLEADSSGTFNTAVGRAALFLNKASSRNTAVGNGSGYYNNYLQTNTLQGSENTYVGFNSGLTANIGRKNAVVGAYALEGSGFYGDQPTLDAYSRNSVVGDSAALRTYGNDNVAMGFKALNANTGGSQHVAVGSRALAKTTASYPNTAVGYSSQDSNTVSGANTSVGSYALMNNKIGYNNTAIGNAAMMEAYNASATNYMFDNTAVGNDALRLARYYGQTAIGAGALRNDTAGIYNTAVGYLAMYENKTGTVNTAIGTSALRLDTSGSGNTAVGVNSLYNHRTGNNNVAMGYNTLSNDIDGGANTAIGNYAMVNHKTEGLNTAIGYETMYYDTAGAQNTAMGWRSLRYTKKGFENVALGVGTIEFTDSSFYNTAVGRGAMFTKGGLLNTAIGYFSSGHGVGAPTSNYYVNRTTTVGAYAGYRNFADENTFVGYLSGYGGGADSLKGIENTGLGTNTLVFTTTGRTNTAVGYGSLFNNSTGSGNIGVGTRTLLNTTTANYNVAVGDSALFSNGTGSSNTGIGSFTNVSASNLTNTTAIGANAFVAQSNSMVLGSISGTNSATSDTKVGIRTTTPDSTFSIADNFLVGSSGTVQYDNSVPVMNYMFKSGSTNADRMVISHSPASSNYGLQYQDVGDKFNFLAGGAGVLTADLINLRVGVGTITPTKKLHVFAGTSGALTNGASQILMEDDASSYFEMSTPAANENGILSSIPATGIRSGIIFGSNNSLKLRSGGNTDRLYIDNAGYTGINRTPTTGGSAGTLQVQATGASDDVLGLYNVTTGNRWTYFVGSDNNLYMYFNGAGPRGNWNNATGAYTATSDKRLKKDFTDYNYGLNTVMALQPSKYHYLDGKSTDPLSVGFMAQDVLKVYPEAVYSNIDKNGKQFYSMDYQSFSVLSIKAIQEQQQIIDKQQKQIDDLLLRVSKLENK